MYDFRGKKWDIVGKRGYWFAFSLLLIIAGLVAWRARGLNYGIDFTGGSLYKFKFERPITTSSADESAATLKVRSIVEGLGIEKAAVQLSGSDEVYIRTQALTDQEAKSQSEAIAEALQTQYGQTGGKVETVGLEQVGPVIGRDLMLNAVKALLLGWVLMMIYIWVRYEFRFGVAALLSLVHDILVLVGCSALLRIEVNSAFVAVVLTIVGYSINDTIIVFDRIRENRRLHRRMTLAELCNFSVLQTAARCINTVLTVLLTLVALFFFGGATIHDFTLALLIGITSGAYSSVFNATCVVVAWDERSLWRPGVPSLARASRGPAPVRAVAGGSAATVAVEGAPAPETGSDTAQRAAPEADKTPKKPSKSKRPAGKRKRRF